MRAAPGVAPLRQIGGPERYAFPAGEEAFGHGAIEGIADGAQAQGIQAMVAGTGLRRESLSLALSPQGNPTLETLPAVWYAAGLCLVVARKEERAT